MLEDKQKKQLETLLVEFVLVLRSAYLAEQGGRPPLSYWEMFQARMRAAARTTTTASEWATQVQRKLQLPALPSWGSRALIELVRFCDENGAHRALLDMVERDTAVLIALSQLIVEERREAAKKGATDGDDALRNAAQG